MNNDYTRMIQRLEAALGVSPWSLSEDQDPQWSGREDTVINLAIFLSGFRKGVQDVMRIDDTRSLRVPKPTQGEL